jgi:Family of unknown function (DUF6069)
MTVNATRPTTESLETRRLLPLALTGGAIGAIINIVVFFIAPVIIGGAVQVATPPTNAVQDLPIFPVVMASLVPAFVGAGVLWLLNRFTSAPVRLFQILGAVIAVLSLVGPFGLPINLGSKITLCIMHLVAATSIVLVLSRAKRV